MKKMARFVAFAAVALVVLAGLSGGLSAQSRVSGFGDRVVVTGSGPGWTAADRRVFQRLESAVVSFSFNEQPLQEAVDFLATLGGVNIVLDRNKVEQGKTVTLRLTDVTLTTAIKLLTEQVALKWVVRDGVVFISDEEGTRREPVTVVHDVSDLLATAPDFAGPDMQLQVVNSQSNTGSEDVLGPRWQPTPNDRQAADQEVVKTRDELLQELVDLIREVIAPGTWDPGTE
jgi:type II secretory pathway component GspD/PulD (secretin)